MPRQNVPAPTIVARKQLNAAPFACDSHATVENEVPKVFDRRPKSVSRPTHFTTGQDSPGTRARAGRPAAACESSGGNRLLYGNKCRSIQHSGGQDGVFAGTSARRQELETWSGSANRRCEYCLNWPRRSDRKLGQLEGNSHKPYGDHRPARYISCVSPQRSRSNIAFVNQLRIQPRSGRIELCR